MTHYYHKTKPLSLFKPNCEELYGPKIYIYPQQANLTKIYEPNPLRDSSKKVRYHITVVVDGEQRILSLGPALYKQLLDVYTEQMKPIPDKTFWQKFYDWICSFFFKKKEEPEEDKFEFKIVKDKCFGYDVYKVEADHAR